MDLEYPPVGFHFKVKFQLPDVAPSDREARFQEVTGLKKSLAVEEFHEGGENRYTHRFPSPAKYGNVVLKRGLLMSSALIDWCFDAIDDFSFQPVELEVTLLNSAHEPSVVWHFVGAYPLGWSVGDLKAQDNSVLVETLEIAYQHHRKSDA